MSYRALMTISDTNADGSVIRNKRIYSVLIGDEMDGGERLAEKLATLADYPNAVRHLDDAELSGGLRNTADPLQIGVPMARRETFEHIPEERDGYINTYCDQVWTVEFRGQDNGMVTCLIQGHDAAGDLRFLRKVTREAYEGGFMERDRVEPHITF